MRIHKRGFINEPFDIAAGFILGILGMVIIVSVYAVSSNVDVDSAVFELRARQTAVAFPSYEQGGSDAAQLIMSYPKTEDKDALKSITQEYFKKAYNDAWMVVIAYPEEYETKDVVINSKTLKKSISKTYVPLPEGGYATVTLYWPLTINYIPTIGIFTVN